jgi:hypothetical protein
MSWFDLTLGRDDVSNDDIPIVSDLAGEASNRAERLAKLGSLVGIAPHAQSRSLFELSWRVSPLLIRIEDGWYNSISNVQELYDPNYYTQGSGPNPAADMLEIINHWSRATGRDMKALPVSSTTASATASVSVQTAS